MTEDATLSRNGTTKLDVPAVGAYARVVRLTAANLATLAGFGLEEVDDVRMAAEEAFVYALATEPGDELHISFQVSDAGLAMDFELGGEWRADDPDEPALAYSAFILDAMCDECSIVETPTCTMHLFKGKAVA